MSVKKEQTCTAGLKDYFHKCLKTDRLDVIIYGATGYAGKKTVQDAVNILSGLHWGIAGRNAEKLSELLEDIGSKTETDLSKTPIIIVGAHDFNGLSFMAKQCRIVVNCCGPYLETGETLIKACISRGTHYVDMSAEPYFMELMQLRYNEWAMERKAYIITGCGFQSFLMDIGINFINASSKGTLNYVEAYTEYKSYNEETCRPIVSVTAWRSFISAIGTFSLISNIRKQLFRKKLPNLEPKLKNRSFLHESEFVCGICLPFSLVSLQVVERSQYHFFDKNYKRPVQFRSYLVFPTYTTAVLFLIWYCLVVIFAQLECTRNLLMNYPKVFSFGFVTDAELPDEILDNISFKITFNGVGWLACKKTIMDLNDKPYDKSVIAKVCGSHPAYGVSSLTLLCSALTILYEMEKIPGHGGVLPPGAAFAKTRIISDLKECGLLFELNNEDDQHS